jgi:hypothetical protein
LFLVRRDSTWITRRIPADHRVEIPVAGTLGEIDAVLLERLVGAFRILGGDPRMSPDLLKRLQQNVRPGARLAQHLSRLATVGGQADQQVLGRDELVAQFLGPLARRGERCQHRSRHVGRAQRGAGRARQLRQPVAGVGEHRIGVGADRPQQRYGRPAVQLDEGHEQVKGVNVWVALRRGTADRVRQRLLALACELVGHRVVFLQFKDEWGE